MFPVPPVIMQCSSSTCRGCPPPVTSGAFVASVGALAAVQLLKFHIIVKVPQHAYPELPHLNISAINIGHHPASSVGLLTLRFPTPLVPVVVFLLFVCSVSPTISLSITRVTPTHTYPAKFIFLLFFQHRYIHAMMG